jgi:uncharacterized LabA/DUF88 family protein
MLNYFFIDGSPLAAQIRALQKADRSFKGRRLDPALFIRYFCMNLMDLDAHDFKRATFYFPKGDEVAVEDYLMVPESHKPGRVRDMHFKFCGQKLKGSSAFNKFVEEKVPKKWRGRFTKSEKGIDIEICCDALKLASASRLERLFLLTNDDDFVPLCRVLKEFGANVSLLHLSDIITPNVSLTAETDSYDVVPIVHLQNIFVPTMKAPPVSGVATTASAALEKDATTKSPEKAE